MKSTKMSRCLRHVGLCVVPVLALFWGRVADCQWSCQLRCFDETCWCRDHCRTIRERLGPALSNIAVFTWGWLPMMDWKAPADGKGRYRVWTRPQSIRRFSCTQTLQYFGIGFVRWALGVSKAKRLFLDPSPRIPHKTSTILSNCIYRKPFQQNISTK